MKDDYLVKLDEYSLKATTLLNILKQKQSENEVAIIEAQTIIKTTNHLRALYLKNTQWGC